MLIEIAFSDTQYSTSMNEESIGFTVEKSETDIVLESINKPAELLSTHISDDPAYVETLLSHINHYEAALVNPSVTILVDKVNRFHQNNEIREAMVTVYSQFMDWARKGDFGYCDEFLSILNPSDYDATFLLCVVMASHPMKSVLSYRQELFSKIRNELDKRYGFVEAENIMRGLK